jgi:hypothetical protein
VCFFLTLLHVREQMVQVFTGVLLLACGELGVTLAYHCFEKLRSHTVLVKLIRLVLYVRNFFSHNFLTEFA